MPETRHNTFPYLECLEKLVTLSIEVALVQCMLTARCPLLVAVASLVAYVTFKLCSKQFMSRNGIMLPTLEHLLVSNYKREDDALTIPVIILIHGAFFARALLLTKESWILPIMTYTAMSLSQVIATFSTRLISTLLLVVYTLAWYLLNFREAPPFTLEMFTTTVLWPMAILFVGVSTSTHYNRITLKQLSQTNKELELANKAKSQFLSIISHEVRTPLHAILGCSELLLSESVPHVHVGDTPKNEHGHRLSRDQVSLVNTILLCGKVLLDNLNSVLDFTRIETIRRKSFSGEESDEEATSLTSVKLLEESSFYLRDVLSHVIEIAAPKAATKQLSLEVKYLPSEEEVTKQLFMGDAVRIRQILLNIVLNAVKFTEVGKVSIQVRVSKEIQDLMTKFPAPSLPSSLPENQYFVTISVSDTGIGIPEYAKSSLFKPFSQVDMSINRRYGGTGLGLAICKSLVEAMKGVIWFESTEKGTTFYIILPLKVAPPQSELHIDTQNRSTSSLSPSSDIEDFYRYNFCHDTSSASDSHSPNVITPVSPVGTHSPQVREPSTPRILIVDDNIINLKVLQKMMVNLGYECSSASSGLEAIDHVKRNPFDIIFLDIEMPGMNGIETCQQIRELTKNTTLPYIYFISGTERKSFNPSAMNGANGFLQKPVSLAQLQKLLNEFKPVWEKIKEAQRQHPNEPH